MPGMLSPWGVQRSRSTEQDLLPSSVSHTPQQIACEHSGAAAASGTTAVDVLWFQIIYHQAAVVVAVPEFDTVPVEEVFYDFKP